MPWHRDSGCLGAAAPVTGAAEDEYNLNVVDCNASVTVARRSSISVSGGLGATVTPSRRPGIQYSALALAAYERGNVVIHRGIYQLQGDDNGHVGRHC